MEQHLPPQRRAALVAATPANGHSSLVEAAGSSQAPTATTQTAVQSGMLSQAEIAELRAVRKLYAWAVFAHTAGQVAPLLAWATLPADELAQRVGSIFLMLVFNLLLHVAPRFYLCHSTQLQIALRLLYYAFPLLRKPRGIQGTLNEEPTPGVVGAVLDTLRVAWGSRLVAVLMAALITPLHVLPLLPHLLLQVYAIAMVRNNSSLCTAPLLAHPLTQQRLQRLYRWMDMLLVALPNGALLLPGRATASTAQRVSATDGSGDCRQHAWMASAQCEGALNFLAAVLGLLLPLLFLLKTEPAAPLARVRLRVQMRQMRQRGTGGMLGLLSATWRRFEAGADELLRELAGRSWLAGHPPPLDPESSSQWQRCVAWLLLLAATWVWCTVAVLASSESGV